MSTDVPIVPRRILPDHSGVFFDGDGARAHDVKLYVNHSGNVLELRGEDVSCNWPLDQVRLVPDQAGQKGLVLRRADDPLARLFTAHRGLAEQFPALKKRTVDVSRGRLLGWAIGALASVALIVFVLVPLMADQLAEYIPPEGERALGEATLDQVRGAMKGAGRSPLRFCEASEGRAALAKMETSLAANVEMDVPLTVHVLDHGMVNAFALPGGHVVFMRGLIEQAESAEEVAAVFAHEMGHVASRDPTRHALRSAGSIGVLGLLFGDFAGGALVLLLTEQLIEAQYSQKAETGADQFAYEVLQASGVAPSAIGEMFERMLAKHGDAEGISSHFLSHPKMAERIAASRSATPDGFVSIPILSDEDWQALRVICKP
ncbi:Peptidase family M48 [Shimia gijangensis]|uniref:Peptidase family M48 n=1 Tax=Shimia gijangensis TaxID=1470563 RepID=A0A1M6MCI6_9RHOB|nr:M48 family metallopeptidase [Shimia gijangensis]SHJ80993.1 Peptidase family M48 [Shimia gijangensis]